MTMMIEKDYSWCCFGCLCRKKKDHQKVGAYDANVAYDEEENRKKFPLNFNILTQIFSIRRRRTAKRREKS
jgi:hypothetical protein